MINVSIQKEAITTVCIYIYIYIYICNIEASQYKRQMLTIISEKLTV